MPTSLYMPDVEVHIAFDSGYTTPAASRTWTDVSSYVELADRISIAFGRQDERSTAGPNQLSLTLDNTDGRFTAGRSASPYYPNVKIGRPIRVRVTPPGGTVVTRFVGFVDEWPVEWDGTDAYAMAKIRATSRLARLGLSARLKSMIESEILTNGPAAYWTLGDPAGSTTASESSGNGRDRLTMTGTGTAVVFGNATGPGSDGLTAGEFANGQYLTAAPLNIAPPFTLRATILQGAVPAVSAAVIDGGVGIFVGSVVDGNAIIGGGLTGPNVNDGETHDVALVDDGTDRFLYVDGVLEDTGLGTGGADSLTNDVLVGRSLTGTVSHVAIYDYALTAAQVAAQAETVLSGASGDRTDERLLRILGWAGVASTEVTTETGVETMTYQETSGQSVVEALRDIESTENGVLFDGRDGSVAFHNRSHRYSATVAATFDMAAQHVESDYAPKLDRSTLANDVTAENPTTGETARRVDEISQDEYGIATGSVRVVADSYDPLLQHASWRVASYAEPHSRVPSLTVDVLAHQGLTPSAQTILGLTIGDRTLVTNRPTQADATTADYFIEGYTETIGPESYSITFNLSPTYPYLNVVVLDDPDRGLDSGSILAL